MLKNSHVFSGFSVNDIEAARKFYQEVLGLEVEQSERGLNLHFGSDQHTFVYEKPDHQPATFTILNFQVEDIDSTIDELTSNGVIFEKYSDLPANQDEKGVLRGKAAGMGPDIAWFKDTAGNTFAILEQ